jgi:hypothetical protein
MQVIRWIPLRRTRRMDGTPVETPLAPPPRSAKWASWLAVVIAFAVVVAIAGGALVWLLGSRSPGGPSGPGGPTACAGNETYSGTVMDQAHQGRGGVVVVLSPVTPQAGVQAVVPTDGSGSWSATVSGGCAYRAQAFWQSDSTGPLLASVSEVSRTSSISVDVSEEPVSLFLFREFSHSPNVTISLEISRGLRFSVDAVARGSVSLGFLPINAASESGADFAVPESMGASASAGSYALLYRQARAFQVVDIEGDSVVYMVPTPEGRFEFSAATDHVTMDEAIELNLARDIYPFVQIAGSGISTYWWDVVEGSGIPLAQNATAFGTELPLTFAADDERRAKFTVRIVNPGDDEDCYVMYRESFEFHLWFYAPSRCSF